MDLGGGSGRAINNAGQVTGGSNNGHAFLYSNGQMMDLGTLPGFDSSFGRGINSLGQVTGSSSTTNSFFHAFLYSNGQMIDLGTLAGRSTVGAGINDAGQVVGWSDQGLGMLYHAFLYSNGQMMDLNDLIDPSLGITLFQATGINNSGQIVANGSGSSFGGHAFLLTPVPEPKTVALLAVALFGIGIWARRLGV